MRLSLLSLSDKRLIVGLGNPGKAYVGTRHNIGFVVIRAFAKARGITFRPMKGDLGELGVAGNMALLLPMTYMNLSGKAVKECVEDFKVPLQQVCVVSDEIYLPFGSMRFRAKGSAGGHKGLVSIIEELGDDFPRLRIGVGLQENGEDLADHVLGRFTSEEKELIPVLVKKACEVLDIWAEQGTEKAIPMANGPLS